MKQLYPTNSSLNAAMALIVAFVMPLQASDDAGAKKTKAPVNATVVDEVQWMTETVGNIQVSYADGTRDKWTTGRSCGQPRVATNGTVGWTVFEPERPAMAATYTIRPNATMVICCYNKVLLVEAAMGFIEEWNFLRDGKHFVVKSRALHGPATIELRETATGKTIGTVKATADDLPEWATPYHE